MWYHPHTHPSISTDSGELARWIGVAHRVGSDMCYWLMPVSGIPISSTTVQHVTRDDMLDTNTMAKIEQFDQKLRERLDDTNFVLAHDLNNYAVNDVNDDFCKPYLDPAHGDEARTPSEDEYANMSNEFQTYMDAQGKVHVVNDC